MLTLEFLARLQQAHADCARHPIRSVTLGGRTFSFDLPGARALMGVVNLSPDSWYRESVCLTAAAAIQRGRVLAAQGADLVDIGAESTLAHSARVDGPQQNSRLLPVIRELAQAGVLVSVETYEPVVAEAAFKAGAAVLNLTGTGAAEPLFRLAAEYHAGVILCHVQGDNVRAVGDFDLQTDPIDRMYEGFARQIELAERCGVPNLFVDPGLGFYYRNLQDSAVRVRHQMTVFLNSFRLRRLGCPVCHALPHAFEYFGEEVRCAEPFFAVLAALGQTQLYRTHEVARTKAVLDTLAVFQSPRRA